MKFIIFAFALLLNFAYAPLRAQNNDVYESDTVEVTDENEMLDESEVDYESETETENDNGYMEEEDDNNSIFNDKDNGEENHEGHDDDKELSMHSSLPVSL